MKKMLKVILLIIAVLFLGLVFFAGYMGFFTTVKIYEKEVGPYTYVFKEFKGDYKLTGPVFDEVYTNINKMGIKTECGIGVYFDDPKVTKTENLRSNCGVIIKQEDSGKIKDLPAILKTGKLDKLKRIVAEFTIKNYLSYMIGPMKAYPALAKYAKENGYNDASVGYEIYDEKAGKIYYIMDIVK
ncbi:MAG: GyrI-like domain-containing protein [Spirochaetota bacterium]